MTTKPTFHAFTVKERDKGRKPIWTRIGAAWPHKEANGINIELDALPLDGRIMLMEPKAGETSDAGADA